jgi:Flp pilus assembly protein TadD
MLAVLTWKQSSVWNNEMSLYSNMLAVSPRSLEAMIGLSNAFYSEKNYDKSAFYAQKALERDFTDFRPYMFLGKIKMAHHQLSEALELLLESQNKNPLSPEVHNILGSLYDELGKSDQAISAFNTALKLNPDDYEANTNLGVTYERLNNLPYAEAALNKALAANSNYAPAWFNLGVVRYKKNDRSGARQAFYEAVKIDSKHVDALTNLSVVCKETGDELCYNDATRRLAAIGQSADKIPHGR